MIDPRAIVDPSAKLGENVEIGPWSIVGPGVEIGDNTVVSSHVIVKGPTVIGADNRILQFSSIGEDTPDLKYKGEPTRLVIGDHNVIREGVTIHRGTVQDRGETTIGDHNLLMAYVHVGHDSVIGSHTILVNNASLAGHVTVGDWAILSGYVLVHQFVAIGAHSFAGASTYLTQDVPPYVMVAGNPASARTINSEGLKRRGFSAESIAALNRAYRILYRKGYKLEEAIAELETMGSQTEAVQPLVEFLRASTRGIVR
ncbi:MAG: acyl-[acyl-carrier-protein]--UDP-N-acetylglucosamine O-acyltransferase [Porticoccaceae bacterium]|nr:acyl-[acyl-carrier-protein]--UDP-N-acetylglucosamine O-acyltransferase [Porticoccaceae bacterium]